MLWVNLIDMDYHAQKKFFFQVCGSPEIPIQLLKAVASYKGIEPDAPLVQWFWEVMEEFSNTERSLFLRFVWGRTRLPRTIADFRGRDFVLQVKYLNITQHFKYFTFSFYNYLKLLFLFPVNYCVK